MPYFPTYHLCCSCGSGFSQLRKYHGVFSLGAKLMCSPFQSSGLLPACGLIGITWVLSCFLSPTTMPAALADTSQIICEVWASNVEEEMRKIRQIIQSYNYIAMVWKRRGSLCHTWTFYSTRCEQCEMLSVFFTQSPSGRSKTTIFRSQWQLHNHQATILTLIIFWSLMSCRTRFSLF